MVTDAVAGTRLARTICSTDRRRLWHLKTKQISNIIIKQYYLTCKSLCKYHLLLYWIKSRVDIVFFLYPTWMIKKIIMLKYLRNILHYAFLWSVEKIFHTLKYLRHFKWALLRCPLPDPSSHCTVLLEFHKIKTRFVGYLYLLGVAGFNCLSSRRSS